MRFITLEQGPHDPIISLHVSRAQKRHKELEADKTFSICAIFAIHVLLCAFMSCEDDSGEDDAVEKVDIKGCEVSNL